MYKTKALIFATITILAISGLNGYFVEKGLLPVNSSILNFLLDVCLFIVAFLSFNNIKYIRVFLFIIATFLISTIVSFALNVDELTIINYLNGLREFIPYFLFPIIYLNFFQSKYKNVFIKKFNTFLHIFLALQIPVALYQFSIEGAGDAVGGTQGTGFSGILSFIIFLSTFYLMTQRFNEKNILRSFMKKSYLLIFWIPAFINETKITYILIPMFLILLVKIVVTNIPKYITIIAIMIPTLFTFNSIYQSITPPQFDSKEFLTSDFLTDYLANNDDDREDIPRFEKLAIFMNNFDEQEILFGKGIGQFKGGTTLEVTPFATMYEWLLQGSIPMLFFLLVQIGIFGTVIFLMYWIVLISYHPAKQRINYSTNLIIFSSFCFLIIQFYNDSLRSLFFCGIITYIICYAISYTRSIVHLGNAN